MWHQFWDYDIWKPISHSPLMFTQFRSIQITTAFKSLSQEQSTLWKLWQGNLFSVSPATLAWRNRNKWAESSRQLFSFSSMWSIDPSLSQASGTAVKCTSVFNLSIQQWPKWFQTQTETNLSCGHLRPSSSVFDSACWFAGYGRRFTAGLSSPFLVQKVNMQTSK